MKKYFFGLIALLVGMKGSLIEAKEVMPAHWQKYNLSICAVFKDEAHFLKEWIAYHQLIGVDHFYLYNNNSSDNFREELDDYINEGIVTLVDWSMFSVNRNIMLGFAGKPHRLTASHKAKEAASALTTQILAYEHALKLKAYHETKWLVFVDVDEFLVPTYADSLTELLEMYKDKAGIAISSLCYDAVERESNQNLLIESFMLVQPPPKNPCREVSKVIFKPIECEGFTWPPYKCQFKNHRKAIKLSSHELRINKYVNRKARSDHVGLLKGILDIDHRLYSEKETMEFLCDGYEIIDQERSIHRFVPSLLQKMGSAPMKTAEK